MLFVLPSVLLYLSTDSLGLTKYCALSHRSSVALVSELCFCVPVVVALRGIFVNFLAKRKKK